MVEDITQREFPTLAVLFGVFLGAKRVIIPTRNVRIPTVLPGGLKPIALLRCLFQDCFSLIGPS